MQALGPTLFPTVPRLLNKIHDTIRANVKESRIKEFFFNWALRRKQAHVESGIFKRDTIWDYIGKFFLAIYVSANGGDIKSDTEILSNFLLR